MTWRNIGQKAVVCDNCGAIFDDRPRDSTKDVVAAAVAEGWVAVGDLHQCPNCRSQKLVEKARDDLDKL